MRIKKKHLFLLVILSVGSIFRIHGLPAPSLSSDEAFSVRVARLSYAGIVNDCAKDVHPPLYYFVLHDWIGVFGDSESSVRGLSVLFGVLSIYLVFLLGTRLFDSHTGIVSAILLAVSSLHIQYSQNARMYTLLLSLSLLSVHIYVGMMTRKGKAGRKTTVGLFVINALLLYTHVYGFFVVLFELSWSLFSFVRDRRRIDAGYHLWPIALSLVSFLPWAGVLLLEKSERPDSWLPLPGVLEIARGFSGNDWLLVTFVSLFFMPLFRKKTMTESVVLVHIIMTFTVVIPLMVSLLVFHAFRLRFLIFPSALFYIVIAYSFNTIRTRSVRIFVACFIGITALFPIDDYYRSPSLTDWRGATAYLDTMASSNDLLIFNAGYTLENGFEYYSRRNDIRKIAFPRLSARINIPVDGENIRELDGPLSEGYENVWVVYCDQKDFDSRIIGKLETYGYVYSEDEELNGIQILKFGH